MWTFCSAFDVHNIPTMVNNTVHSDGHSSKILTFQLFSAFSDFMQKPSSQLLPYSDIRWLSFIQNMPTKISGFCVTSKTFVISVIENQSEIWNVTN